MTGSHVESHPSGADLSAARSVARTPSPPVIDRAAVLALLDRVIADPGHAPAAGALALVLRMQVARLPVLPHVQRDAPGLAITAGVAR